MTDPPPVAYNLCAEPWINVQRDGRASLESLRSLIFDAHLIDDLDWGSPLEAAGLQAVVGAVIRDVFGVGDVDDFESLWRRAIDT